MSLITIDKVNDEIRNTITVMDKVIDALSNSTINHSEFIELVKTKAYNMTMKDAHSIIDLIKFDKSTLLFTLKEETPAGRDVINLLNYKYYKRINEGLKYILKGI